MSRSSDRTDSDELTGENNPVTPTIVGGRPPRREGRGSGFPLGIEVLLKKASVDREFREALLEKRSEAAAEIGLELSPSEAAALDSIPRGQIDKIIEKTTIPDEHRRVFLGKVAAAMLAMLGVPLVAEAERRIWTFGHSGSRGVRPYKPEDPRPVNEVPPNRFPRTRSVPGPIGLWISTYNIKSNSMTVSVRYECPFEEGKMRLLFGRYGESEEAIVGVTPARHRVIRGEDKVTFFVKGRNCETQWIMVEIRNNADQCQKAPWEFLDGRKLKGGVVGNYSIPGCAICTIIGDTKVWS